MIVGVLTTCHTQYTWDSSICIFLFNRTTLRIFVTYLTGALYVHPLWFYKHQHENWVRSKLFIACQRWWFQWWFWFVPSVPGYLQETEEHKPDPWRNPIERNHMGLQNCRWTIVTDQHSWNVSTQNAFSVPFAAILVNCAPSGEMDNYCTPHIIPENSENFLIHRCKYVYSCLKCIVYDKLLKPWQSFWITLYVCNFCVLFLSTYYFLMEIIFWVLTTCHTQYTWDRSICFFFI